MLVSLKASSLRLSGIFDPQLLLAFSSISPTRTRVSRLCMIPSAWVKRGRKNCSTSLSLLSHNLSHFLILLCSISDHRSVSPTLCLSLSFCLFVSLCLCLSLSFCCLSIFVSLCIYLSLSFCLTLSLSLSLSLCLTVCL